MVRFSLFGIPVEIQPWFWVTAALLGGALRAASSEQLLLTCLFMLVAAVSILVHELGHAVTGRRLGGGTPRIVLWAFGGLAYNSGGRFTQRQRFWMIFMGPGAGFLLLALVILVLCLSFGLRGGLSVSAICAFGGAGARMFTPTPEAIAFVGDFSPRFWLARSLIWINLWWGLVNLLPVLPLDGGHIAEMWIKPRSRMLLVSGSVAAAVAIAALLFTGDVYVCLLFGFLAFRSFQDHRGSPW